MRLDGLDQRGWIRSNSDKGMHAHYHTMPYAHARIQGHKPRCRRYHRLCMRLVRTPFAFRRVCSDIFSVCVYVCVCVLGKGVGYARLFAGGRSAVGGDSEDAPNL